MYNSRNATGAAIGRRLLSLFVAAIAMAAFNSVTATSASAEDVPFWEQADRDAAKKKSASVSSKKKYASKKSNKSYASDTSSKPSKKLGGYAEDTEPVKKYKKKGVKVAALGGDDYYESAKPKKSLSGGVSWSASSGCLDSGLKAIIYDVASNYGPVTVNSTCRSKGHNAAVGGAPKSKHLSGDAVDFRVHGNVGAVYAYLKGNGGVGGLKHYGGGLFHIDNGERRSW